MSIDLEAIKARAAAATRGPWTYVDNGFDGYIMSASEYLIVGGEPAEGRIEPDAPNADFIAHAREDIPALLAEVERLNEKVRFQNKLLHAPVVDIFPNLTPKEKAEDAEIVRLENELYSVTAERDALKERTRWVPVSEKPPEGDCFVYEANKNKVHFAYAEELDAPNWSVTHWMPFHLPEAPKEAQA